MLYYLRAHTVVRPTLYLCRAIRPVRFYHSDTVPDKTDSDSWPHPIFSSERISDRKSVFLAHATKLPHQSLVPAFLDHLTNLPKLKRATHCMYAYRTSETSRHHPEMPAVEKVVTGQHDGGESGSGNHLSRLLEVMGCENVVVVVSRWYGGIQLGSDRWRRISDVAKEALNKGGFRNEKKGAAHAATPPKKKRRRK
ncbi:ribosomal protein S5 domain 2-like protein [Dendrothele bispora CBS 962.96]|uniref:Ribosomal protein S5 domain 2-like protein n=1 Tax=Dendrothele bispora (strain CBS 962.96) TaxID=1314807 RepID=A0A4S8LKA0_DENBC|nr:ribosomal protein S5 domain 2-like protein [Dendrothele bispora CBS 962.96]